MDHQEAAASAETELREAILSEFLKPELPAPIVLLRHCEQYAVKRFDIWAANRLERLLSSRELCAASNSELTRQEASEVFQKYLADRVEMLPTWFFGCAYSVPFGSVGEALESDFPLGSPWGRCIEYCMLALVDHGGNPMVDEVEFMKRYGRINGHFFLTYALKTRLDVWRSRADKLIELAPNVETRKPKYTRIFVDDRHKQHVHQFDKIRQTTTVDKWVKAHRGISRTQFTDYLAGRIDGNISDAKRKQIESAISESTS